MNLVLILMVSLLPVAGLWLFRYLRMRREQPDLENTLEEYTTQRNTAIGVTPMQLQLSIDSENLAVYGIVMDIALPQGFATLACYITGAANFCQSSGDNSLGAGRIKAISDAAHELTAEAQEYTVFAVPVLQVPPLQEGLFQFTFLTNVGWMVAQVPAQFILDGTSPLFPLYEKGATLILQIRNTAQA
jgi:hypothetical protein